jgi:hypothetical protein
MPITQKRVLDFLEEWRTYIPRFESLSAEAQAQFLKEQGFASLHDLLAHVVGWWDEAYEIAAAAVEAKDRPPRKYDFDVFNAESLARYKDLTDAQMLARFEEMRRKLIDFVIAHPTAIDEHRRVRNWLYAVVIHHMSCDHGIGASRFVVLDVLENDWAEYLADFNGLPPEKQAEFLEKQGFPRFRDLVAHIIAWWDDGLEAIQSLQRDPAYIHPDKDTDSYNAEAVERFGKLDEAEVLARFESTRRQLVDLVMNLPEDILNHKDIQSWLKWDVIEHLYEHAG